MDDSGMGATGIKLDVLATTRLVDTATGTGKTATGTSHYADDILRTDSSVDFNPIAMCTVNCASVLERNRSRIKTFIKAIVLILYLIYFGYAQTFYKNDEPSWRLIGVTIFGAVVLLWKLLLRTGSRLKCKGFGDGVKRYLRKKRRRIIIRWSLYVVMTLFMVVYVIVEVAMKTPDNLRSLMGIFIFPGMLFLYSNNRRKVNWHTVFWGMSIQFLMALMILKTSWGAGIIRWIGTRLEEYLGNGHVGSVFIFGKNYKDHNFVFGTMVQIYVLMVGISVLTYLGVIEFLVKSAGTVLAFCLQTTPAEGINAVGNIFLHLPESVMLIQNSLDSMTPSQLFVTYSGGLATVGGTALVLFISFGIEASHLVAASSMSAPAALAVAKLVYPSHKGEIVPEVDSKGEQGIIRKAESLMESVIIGIGQSTKLIVQAVTFILTFVMILEFVNRTLSWFGERIQVENMTVEYLFSYVFYPFAFLMGAPASDCLKIGELIAVRTFSLAVMAYQRQSVIIQNRKVFRDYLAESSNRTWIAVDNGIYLPASNTTLVGGIMEPRSDVITTYALCGSASFAIAGLVIGSYKAILPQRINEVTSNILRAVIVGTAASFLTACFAGLLYDENV